MFHFVAFKPIWTSNKVIRLNVIEGFISQISQQELSYVMKKQKIDRNECLRRKGC